LRACYAAAITDAAAADDMPPRLIAFLRSSAIDFDFRHMPRFRCFATRFATISLADAAEATRRCGA